MINKTMEHKFEYYGSRLKISKFDLTDDAYILYMYNEERKSWDEVIPQDFLDATRIAQMLKVCFGRYIKEQRAREQ